MRETASRMTTRAAQFCWAGMGARPPVEGTGQDAPLFAVAGEEELEEMEGEEEGNERNGEGPEEAGEDVAEDVVAELVGEDEGDFVRCAFGDGGVPDDDALGGTDAGDVGVELRGLVAGVHEKHAGGRDGGGVGASDDLLETGYEGGVGLLEGIEVIEEGVDDVGDGEEADDSEGAEGKPGGEPPAAGEAADEIEDAHDTQGAEDEGEEVSEESVVEPGGEGLDGEAVGEAAVTGIKCDGQVEDGEEGEELEGEGKALEPAVFADVVGDVAHAGCGAGGKEKEEDEDGPELGEEMKGYAGVGERLGGGEFVRGKGVGGVVGGGRGQGAGFSGGGEEEHGVMVALGAGGRPMGCGWFGVDFCYGVPCDDEVDCWCDWFGFGGQRGGGDNDQEDWYAAARY